MIDLIPFEKLWFFLFFIFFKFGVLGFGCGNSESYKPRRVPTQRETSSKFVILFIHSFIHWQIPLALFFTIQSFIYFCRDFVCHVTDSASCRCCLLHSCAFPAIGQDAELDGIFRFICLWIWFSVTEFDQIWRLYFCFVYYLPYVPNEFVIDWLCMYCFIMLEKCKL